MTLISVPNTFNDNAVIDDDTLNANFAALVNALSGIVDTIEFVMVFNGTNPVLTLNQRGAGEIAKFQLNGVDKVIIKNNGQIESTVVTGIAPLIITSTTKVANLNADQIDGLEAAAFVPKTGATLTGFLTLNASPTAALHAVNKQYVDTVVAGVFSAGTKLLFGDNIPVGWTRVNVAEDRLIKLARSGETIGSAGGDWVIIGLSITSTALTVNQIPAHHHDFTYSTIPGDANITPCVNNIQTTGLTNTVSTTNTGSGDPHGHTISHDGLWRPRYEIWAAATKD